MQSSHSSNAIAGATLAFASEVAAAAGDVAGSNWSNISANIFLPVVDNLYAGGPTHLQDKQYLKGELITQSDVGLLQYPLELNFSAELKVNDLLYYENVTRADGFYTG